MTMHVCSRTRLYSNPTRLQSAAGLSLSSTPITSVKSRRWFSAMATHVCSHSWLSNNPTRPHTTTGLSLSPAPVTVVKSRRSLLASAATAGAPR
jgi:hypothetical protein